MGDQQDEAADKKRPHVEKEIRTGGGSAVEGDIKTEGGDFVGRDKVMFSGNVIVLKDLSPESLKQLGKMIDFKTEATPEKPAGIQGAQTVDDRETLQDSIDQALDLFDAADEQGVQAEEMSTGVFKISRVDLLLKKAILLRSESDEMLLDHVERGKSKWEQEGGQEIQLDLNVMFEDYDETPQRSKLQEAYRLLEEANKLDPTNTEVLLQMAELLIYLTPDDPKDEERILYRIKKLLDNPKDDTEKFHLAQATFLLGSTRDQVDIDMLIQAREMFAGLGRVEWVRQCEDVISSTLDAREPEPMSPTAPDPQPPPQGGFNPIGRWHIQVMDAVGSVMYVEYFPNGTFQSVQQATSMGLNIQGQGQWAFNPFNNSLEMQGLINNMQPFMLGIFIQGPQENGFYGIGTDGYGYFLSRA